MLTSLKFVIVLSLFGNLAACASNSAQMPTNDSVTKLGSARMISTKAGNLSVLDVGSAAAQNLPALVLWPSVFADKSMYLPLVEQFRGKARLVLIDGPGHGSSGPMSANGFSMKDCAIAMKTIVDELGIRSATVGGTSWGGLVGGEFALLYPNATDGVVLLNTPVFAEPGIADRMIVLGMRLIGGTELFRNGVAKGFFTEETRKANGNTVQQFYTGIQQSNHSAMADAVNEVLVKRKALAPRLPSIAAPTLFVVGEFDDMYPADRLKNAALTIPKVHYATVPTKHISIVDQPAQVGGLIEAFMFKRLAISNAK